MVRDFLWFGRFFGFLFFCVNMFWVGGGVCLVGVFVLYGEYMFIWLVVRNVLAIWEYMFENFFGGFG